MSSCESRASRRRRHGFKRSGFTLVELLVVIGIISVLISMLLPALSVVRRQANTLKCLSNLRQLGLAFHSYSHLYKGALPVARQDYPDVNGVLGSPTGKDYWMDLVAPFVTKGANPTGPAATQSEFNLYRNCVLWGCPVWEGYPGQDADEFRFGVSRYNCGYTMNCCPTYRVDYPVGFTPVPKAELQMRYQGAFEGRCSKIGQWTRASDRMLLCDATLWFMGFYPSDSAGTLAQQDVGRVVPSGVGASAIDRYRHGKYPRISGSKYLPTNAGGGREMFNVLFVDGHASTLQSYKDGYIAIRMRYP